MMVTNVKLNKKYKVRSGPSGTKDGDTVKVTSLYIQNEYGTHGIDGNLQDKKDGKPYVLEGFNITQNHELPLGIWNWQLKEIPSQTLKQLIDC